ncbi:MAG: YigZ family protein [Limnochordia bacterium]|jgi:uncharacterized YigZ family protein
MGKYRVVTKRTTSSLTIRKSEFIAHVVPIRDEEHAWAILEEIREQHKDATHNVWAWRLGDDEQVRFSDDGEPSGTAGRPVLEVIQREDICNVLVVVTRYFGGILLGAGGLIRAYSRAATQGLKEAPKGYMVQQNQFAVQLDYPFLGKLQNELHSIGGQMTEVDYGAQVKAQITVPPQRAEYMEAFIRDLTNGTAQIQPLEPCWVLMDR